MKYKLHTTMEEYDKAYADLREARKAAREKLKQLEPIKKEYEALLNKVKELEKLIDAMEEVE